MVNLLGANRLMPGTHHRLTQRRSSKTQLTHLFACRNLESDLRAFPARILRGKLSRVRQAVTLAGGSYINPCFNHLGNQLFRRYPGVWWNFSFMRKYLVELQACVILPPRNVSHS